MLTARVQLPPHIQHDVKEMLFLVYLVEFSLSNETIVVILSASTENDLQNLSYCYVIRQFFVVGFPLQSEVSSGSLFH